MSIPQKEQDIIIDACCSAYDHYAGYYAYAKLALEKAGIEFTYAHEEFVDWYLSTWENHV